MTNSAGSKTEGIANLAADGVGSVKRTVRIGDPLGLHFRVAERVSTAAKGFTSAITVRHGTLLADGRSPIDLIMLVVLPGAELIVEAVGSDAAAAVDTIAKIFTASGD